MKRSGFVIVSTVIILLLFILQAFTIASAQGESLSSHSVTAPVSIVITDVPPFGWRSPISTGCGSEATEPKPLKGAGGQFGTSGSRG